MRILQRLLGAIFNIALAHGVLLWLASKDIHPDIWIAKMVGLAETNIATNHTYWILLGISGFLGLAIGPTVYSFFGQKWIPRLTGRQRELEPDDTKLNYLGARDYGLGPAIIQMARKSAWGKWYAARDLITTGVPIDVLRLLSIVTSDVMGKILDGDLVVRGRNIGQTAYEVIPRTDWRNAALHFSHDPMTIWKMRIVPTGVVITERDGTVHTETNPETIAHLSRYDSLLVDSGQFERLWPQTDVIADKQRRKFLKEARRRKLDADTIKSLSD